MSTTPNLPGRLGTPGLDLKDDPRADPRMVAAMEPLGMHVAPAPSPVTAANTLDELLAYCVEAEMGFNMLGEMLNADLGSVDGVSSRTEVITGIDGNDVNLYIHTPDEVDGPMPCIVHTHGGGHGDSQSVEPELCPLARRPRRNGHGGDRCRVPELGRRARSASVPCRAERLRLRRSVGPSRTAKHSAFRRS